jgi:hypothetical protein
LRSEAGRLVSCELGHVVVDPNLILTVKALSEWLVKRYLDYSRVNSSVGASSTASQVAKRRRDFWRSIVCEVAISRAATLEGVVKIDPAANLMDQSTAQIIVGRRTAGERRVKYSHAIILVSVRVRGGEGGVAEETGSGARFGANGERVESVGIALVQGDLHDSLLRIAKANVIAFPRCPRYIVSLTADRERTPPNRTMRGRTAKTRCAIPKGMRVQHPRTT